MRAILKTYRQSPRKVRLLADLIRGKKVNDAKNVLMFADKRAAPVFAKVLDSAIANAKQNFSLDAESLFVKEATVNQGVVLKRSMPRARGSAFPIHKRTSHIHILLGIKNEKSETLNPRLNDTVGQAKSEKISKPEKITKPKALKKQKTLKTL